MSAPKISIIVPVYKVEPYLRKCVDSILAQTFTDYELILVDDGSPDNCGKICEEYAAADSRVKVIHQNNQGLSVARRVGLNAAKGEWIGWVDSDDWIEPNHFAALYNAAVGSDVDMVSCDIAEEKNGVTKYTKQFCGSDKACDQLRALLRRQIRASVWNRLYRREAIEKSGAVFFDRDVCPIMEDTQFNSQFLQSDIKTKHIAVGTYHYLIREGSLSIQKDKRAWWARVRKANEKIYEILKDWPDKETIRYRKSLFRQMYLGDCYHLHHYIVSAIDRIARVIYD